MEKIIIGAVGAAFGFASGLLVPWVKWEIEKRKEQRNARIQLIDRCKQKIRSTELTSKQFLHTTEYAELRVHLPEETTRHFESQRGIVVVSTSRPNTFENEILDVLAELEKKWRLR